MIDILINLGIGIGVVAIFIAIVFSFYSLATFLENNETAKIIATVIVVLGLCLIFGTCTRSIIDSTPKKVESK